MAERQATATRSTVRIEPVAVFGAALVGASLCGLVLHLWSADLVATLARAVWGTGATVGWIVLLVSGVVLAGVFVAAVGTYAPRTEARARAVADLEGADGRAAGVFVDRSALGTAFGVLGIGYGLAIGVVLFGLLVPLWTRYVVGEPAALLFYHPVALLAWAIYGAATGFVYGSMVEKASSLE